MPLFDCNCFSQTLGVWVSFGVILPQPKRVQGETGFAFEERKFPTLWLLHGLSDDHTIWRRRTSIERHLEPFGLAAVMPAVNRSFYRDMAQGPRYWTFVTEEMPALVRCIFPLSAAREDNFVAGASMGGYGALKMGLRCADRFAAAVGFSGALDVARLAGDAAQRTPEMKTIFGDAPTLAQTDDDLFHVAAKLAESGAPKPRLYLCCGSQDPFHADNRRFLDHTRNLGFDVAYTEEPVGHDWGYWDREMPKVLEWLGPKGQ